ncbi:MAG: lipoyl(octanoyl) transferase LipB [Hyphomicrobiales bacterium]|nr:lipoyl(octanoyl) transferase LipB [Hyphomicrobiales bacterium]
MKISETHQSDFWAPPPRNDHTQPHCPEPEPPTLIDRLDGVEWLISRELVPYPFSLSFMENRVEDIYASRKPDTVWLLEHPPLLTAGTSAKADELLSADTLPVYPSGRGGRYTYHGPGQRVAYVMLDLRKRGSDVRAFVCALENWLIATLAELGIQGERRADRIGVWVSDENGTESKIAALGIRVRRWISFHGVALNLAPNLSHFENIIPCGLSGYSVTSLEKLGRPTTLEELDRVLIHNFATTVGKLNTAPD